MNTRCLGRNVEHRGVYGLNVRRPGVLFRREARYFVELVGITAVAVAQPVFNVIEQAPEELVNRGAGAFEITVFAVGLVVLPPPPSGCSSSRSASCRPGPETWPTGPSWASGSGSSPSSRQERPR